MLLLSIPRRSEEIRQLSQISASQEEDAAKDIDSITLYPDMGCLNNKL